MLFLLSSVFTNDLFPTPYIIIHYLKPQIEPLLSRELLRNRLTAFPDYMLAFIYLAYAMMTLLLETAPASEDTWIERLGDLGTYRMAIRDDKVKDREIRA